MTGNEVAEHSLLQDLLRTDTFSGKDFLDRAAGLGVEFDGELVMLVAGPTSRDDTQDGHLELEVQALRDALRHEHWPALVAGLQGDAVAVLPAAGDDVSARLRDVIARLHAGSATVTHLGVSRPTLYDLMDRFGLR